ncbi:hypothetical protein [Paraliomyxa miuraensis]|uniref:hypothetical protein n=1 Tax=Paraliomyxa miuraensis TaxID=376150 RepID=UPI0022560F35|nr:hypothetical protein [Paraliomyxa miuraensis]MCX4245979.1 hypothetical protein [Paraliomyxa miuraensis]
MAEPSTDPTASEPAPEAVRAESGSPSALGDTWLGTLAGPLCLVLVSGVVMPPHRGLVWPLTLALVMVVVGERRLVRLASARVRPGLGMGNPVARTALLGTALASVAVLATVLARAAGSLMVEVPAALWGAGAAIVAGLAWSVLVRWLPQRARPVVLVALTATIPIAGVMGTRFEAEGPHAHGWAHSGAILGIHPFQTTAILVDGQGPIDLPINDYVEPDGGRGYGPRALADAIDRALASAADRVHPDGPARIRRALLDAEVEAVVTPAVHERLDRAPNEATQPRFVVRSGSFGRGSRVEFVCPGRRIDPRGPQGETVMSRMCADKYASEASAGLGVTGRWSGYSEGRGQDRGGLHALWGWTRGDDVEGRRVIERETRIWAWMVLGLVAAMVLLRPLASFGRGVRGIGGAMGGLAVAALVLGVVSGVGDLAVGAWPVRPSWEGGFQLAAWLPALALGALPLFGLELRAGEAGAAQAGRGVAVPAVVVVVGTLILATALPALRWALPWSGADGLELVPFVRGLAEAIGERHGLTIFEVEGAVASSLVALLLGGALATGAAGVAARSRLGPHGRTPVLDLASLGCVVAIAAGLVVSRKTAGAAALVPGMVGMALVLGSGLSRLATRAPSSKGAGAMGRAVRLGWLPHLGWTALGAALVWAAVEPLPAHPFVTLCTVAGLMIVIGAGVASAFVGRPRPDPDPTLERHGGGRL